MPNNLEEELRTIQTSIIECNKKYKEENNPPIKEKILNYKKGLQIEEEKVLKELRRWLVQMNTSIKTKWGTARLDHYGYYTITSSKKDNNGKLLHRLIATDYFGDWINDPNEPFDIHHIDGDKTNNCVLNLIPIKRADHQRLHQKGKIFTKEHIQKIIKKRRSYSGKNNPNYGNHRLGEDSPFYGRQHSIESKLKMSKKKNNSGYFRVSERKNSFVYRYYENGKDKTISSKDINKLEKKVKEKGLKWIEF